MTLNKAGFFFLLVFLSILTGFSPGPKDKPNVIIITIDTLRADHVGCYGYYRDTTPSLDKFGAKAVVFKNAVAQASYTVGSMASFITAKQALNNITMLFESLDPVCVLNPYDPTLTQLLKKTGYASCFISDNPSMFQIKGLKNGFDDFIEVGYDNPAVVTQGAVAWLRGHRDSRFFIWVHYLGPHSPYRPNLAASLQAPLKNKDKTVPLASRYYERLGFISLRAAEAGHDNLNYYINNYDGKIRLTDESLGVLLDEITKLGLDKDSIIVIAADHGEEFGEHELYCNHGGLLYNSLLHVPLVIKFPGLEPKGKVIAQAVGLVDVIPTIAEALRITGQKFDGESLLPLLDGPAQDRYIFSDDWLKTSVVHGRWKLIHDLSFGWIRNAMSVHKTPMPDFVREYELYDLEADASEQKDLYQQDLKIAAELRRELSDFEARGKSVMENQLLPLFREKAEGGPSGESQGNREAAEALRSLGYLQ